MNQNTEQNINEAIDWLQQTGGAIQDFAAEQAPLYCREVVLWAFWEGVSWTSLGLIVSIVISVLLFRNRKWLKSEYDDVSPAGFFIPVFGTVAIAVGLLVAAFNVTIVIKAKVAPRLVIVEHLRGLK